MATEGPLIEADGQATGARYTSAPAVRVRATVAHEDDGITSGGGTDPLPAEADVPGRYAPAPGAGAGALTDAGGGTASPEALRQAHTAQGR